MRVAIIFRFKLSFSFEIINLKVSEDATIQIVETELLEFLPTTEPRTD